MKLLFFIFLNAGVAICVKCWEGNTMGTFSLCMVRQTPSLMPLFQDNLGKLSPEKYFDEAGYDGVAVVSAGPYAYHLHIAPDR